MLKKICFCTIILSSSLVLAKTPSKSLDEKKSELALEMLQEIKNQELETCLESCQKESKQKLKDLRKKLEELSSNSPKK